MRAQFFCLSIPLFYLFFVQFIGFRHQAIECFLAKIQPTYPVDDGQWNPDAVDRFESLTHGKYHQ